MSSGKGAADKRTAVRGHHGGRAPGVGIGDRLVIPYQAETARLQGAWEGSAAAFPLIAS